MYIMEIILTIIAMYTLSAIAITAFKVITAKGMILEFWLTGWSILIPKWSLYNIRTLINAFIVTNPNINHNPINPNNNLTKLFHKPNSKTRQNIIKLDFCYNHNLEELSNNITQDFIIDYNLNSYSKAAIIESQKFYNVNNNLNIPINRIPNYPNILLKPLGACIICAAFWISLISSFSTIYTLYITNTINLYNNNIYIYAFVAIYTALSSVASIKLIANKLDI